MPFDNFGNTIPVSVQITELEKDLVKTRSMIAYCRNGYGGEPERIALQDAERREIEICAELERLSTK